MRNCRRHALVVGEPGVGKTCVLRALRQQLSPTAYKVHYIAHVTLGRRDFYRQLCHALGIESKATPAAMFSAIQRDCTMANREHRLHVVLVLDEVQLMADSVLSNLHVLANFEWDAEPLLSFVFVGLPEFQERLRLSLNRSLLTRIHTRVELSPASPEMTSAYVRKRLEDAGATSEIFTRDGLTFLHEVTGGVLRSIDVIADAAMRVAADADEKLVDRDSVRSALAHTLI